MDDPRRRFLTLIGSIAITSLASWGNKSYARLQIPLTRPVKEPVPPEITQAEKLIIKVLDGLSEDQPLAMAEIIARETDLKSLPPDTVKMALLDLLWRSDIEEVDDGKFRRVRSGHG